MPIRRNINEINIEITMEGRDIPWAQEVTCLGAILDRWVMWISLDSSFFKAVAHTGRD